MIPIILESDVMSTIDLVWQAKKRINTIVKKTPLIKSHTLSEQLNAEVYLKLENLHEIGAFKVRGAANKILSISHEEQRRGITTFSTGNHGLAVAYVAKQLGIQAVICISNRVPKAKIDAIKRWGAQIEIVGQSQDEAGVYCQKLHKEHGLTVIKPFDDPYVIAGQGTIGLELLEDLPELSSVIVPLSGGGLLAGIGLSLKMNNPIIDVYGVSMERSPVMYESLRVGKPIELQEQQTLADSLLGGIGVDNKYTFGLVQKYMDKALLVSEESIAKAMAFMLINHSMVIEGAAATGIAALAEKIEIKHGSTCAIIISGQNIDLDVHLKTVSPYLSSPFH
jgi:threonine dehydratase